MSKEQIDNTLPEVDYYKQLDSHGRKLKTFYGPVTGLYPYYSTTHILNLITKGNGVQQRKGDTIELQSLYLYWYIRPNSSGSSYLDVIYTKDSLGALPTVSNIYNNGTSYPSIVGRSQDNIDTYGESLKSIHTFYNYGSYFMYPFWFDDQKFIGQTPIYQCQVDLGGLVTTYNDDTPTTYAHFDEGMLYEPMSWNSLTYSAHYWSIVFYDPADPTW